MTRSLMILLAASAAGVLVWLVPPNRRALAGVLRTPSGRRSDVAFRRSALAWVLSLAAIFSGPFAPLVALVAYVTSRIARRTVQGRPYPDPEDIHLVKTAVSNSFGALGLTIVIGIFAYFFGFFSSF